MTEIYRSKVDTWFIVVMMLSAALPIVLSLGNVSALLITLASGGFISLLFLWLIIATKYEVNDSQLIIHTGFNKIYIPMGDIKSALPSRGVLASPALSLDRLLITYGQNKSVLISPKNKDAFLKSIGQD